MEKRLWILGPDSIRMRAIEDLLRACGEKVAYADHLGKRVKPENARFVTSAYYRIETDGSVADEVLDVDDVHKYFVECGSVCTKGEDDDANYVARMPIKHELISTNPYVEVKLYASSHGKIISIIGRLSNYPNTWERVAIPKSRLALGAYTKLKDGRVAVRATKRRRDPGALIDGTVTACVLPELYLSEQLFQQ